MKSEWKKVPLRKLVGYISKGIAPIYSERPTNTTISVLNQKCNRNFQISYAEARLHDMAQKKVPAERLIRKDDILINSTGTGTAGRVAQIRNVPCTTTVDGHMIILRANEKVMQRYLGYAIKAHQSEILQLDEGSTGQTELNRERLLDEIMIYYPESVIVQEKIVTIFESIDQKIAVNKKINDNLEQQLHQLFIQTFNGCDTNISLGKVVKTTSGGTPARKHREYYSNGTINWVKSKELTGQYLFDTEESLTSLGVAMSSAKILPAHSVLIAMYGATVGEHGITTKEMACNQAICALLENKDYPYTYLFQIAKENQQNLVNLAIGSAQQNISQILLKQLSVHSDVATIHQYHCLALPLHKEIELLQSENRLLSTTRDALLPELMTGELDLSSVDF